MDIKTVVEMLPQLQAGSATTSLETWLATLCNAVDARSIGFRWPLHGEMRTQVVQGNSPPMNDPATLLTPHQRDALSESKTITQEHDGKLWVFAVVSISGRRPGMVWACLPRSADAPMITSVFSTIAAFLGASPLLVPTLGAVIDQTRLLQRIADSAIVCGRMAHDFDNILTGILGFTDLTLPMLPVGSQPQQYITEVSKVGQRGIIFTQQLHQLSRSGQIKPQPCLIANVLSMEETRLRPTLKPEHRLAFEVPPDLPAVAIDGQPLQTVISHVLDNAVEASPKGGTIRVTGQVIHLTDEAAAEYLGQVGAGPHVELLITDQGTGIKPEVRNRLFVEPFYTTKTRHRGLGLAIIYRILHAHRGGIQLDSSVEPPTGASVRLVLPIAVKKPAVIRS